MISAAVAANDAEAMAATYHPDAVLIMPAPHATGTILIAEQLVAWGAGMDTIRAEGRRASVSFRFSSRQVGPSDCHFAVQRNHFIRARTQGFP